MVVITGEIGIGKTTVCRKLIEIARARGYSCGGVVTGKTRDGRTLVVEDVATGRSAILASSTEDLGGPRTPGYSFSPPGLEFGSGAITSGRAAGLLVVDEIGQLEIAGEGFGGVVEAARAARRAIVVIRRALLGQLLSGLGPGVKLFEATEESRDALAEEIAAELFGKQGD